MGATGRTEKRVVRVRFSYKHRVFVENLIVLDLDDKFDLVLSMSWLARHDPVVNWEKRTLVRFGRNTTESDAPVSVAHAPQVASDHTVEAEPCVAASGAHTQVTTTEAVVESVSNQKSDLRCVPTSMRVSTLGVDRLSMEETSATSSSYIVGVSAPGVDTAMICSKITEASAVRRRGNKSVPAPGVDTNSAARRRGVRSASTPGVDDAASSVGGCKRPTPGKLACSSAAGLHEEAICNQAGLDCVRPRKESAGGYDNGNPSKAGPGRGTSEAGLPKKKRQRKQHKLRKSRSGTETLQEMSAGQASDTTSSVETLNVLTRTRTGLQYRSMEMENPPTSASELTSLPAMSWMRFANDLYDGRIEQICILSDLERMKSEAEELKQLHAANSLKASPFYDVLREHKDVLPDEIPAELPQDKGIQHEIDLVPGTKYCVTRQWPLPRDQVKAIDDFFESRRQAGQVRESKSPHSAPTFCVKKPQGGWRIVHAYNKLNDATIPAQTPIPRKDVVIDSMAKSTIYSALDLRDGFYQILTRESDIALTAVSTPSGMLWEWLVMPQGLKNAPATFNRCVTHLLRSARDFAPSYFDDVFVHSRAVNGKTDVGVHKEHLLKLLGLMRKHKLYANLKKCIFGASEIPILGCLVGKNGVRPDPEKVIVISEWPTLSNVKELRQFLGLATYLCKYVENYAGKIRPLSQLLKKEAEWKWTAECQQAFDAVKQGLTEAPILAVADQDRPFHVVCDASEDAR
ncbi:hypothetical protein PC117_g24726 [Phytophthora cactorum]|uniref:Reverse transcriptase domain-containing protein n=1 Tax=Phytophthora cactorum TaxID=29920 RepID=A0A8T1AYE9_9STRA|nr:hypothetical protein PC117_g24726 [Phytophthora cactorum]